MATLRLVAIGIGIALLQAVALQIFPTALYPDLVLVFALAMGLRSQGLSGLVLAFGIGFLIDVGIASAQPGLYALLRGTACGLTRVFDRALYLRGGLPWAIYVAGYVLLDSVLLGLVTNAWPTTGSLLWRDILIRTPGVALATAVCAAPLLRLFQRLDPPGGGDTGWGMLGSRIG